MDLVLSTTSDWSQAINLIEEDDGGSHLIGLVKQQPQLPLRLSDPLAQTVGSLPHEEGHLPVLCAALTGEGSGEQGFSSAWWTIEQDTPWRLDGKLLEQLWVEEGEHDHLLQCIHMLLQSTNGLKSDPHVHLHWLHISQAGACL